MTHRFATHLVEHLKRKALQDAARKVLSPTIVCILAISVFALAMALSIKDLHDFAGVDLRNRIVGARALLMSLDPYSVEWRPGMPLWLADFNQRYPGASKVTVPPTVLFAYVPFAELSHRTQQLIWWALQWIAMVVTIFALLRSFNTAERQRIFLLAAVFCFIGSWFWRLHVERGQYYIFLTLFFCLDIAALRREKRHPAWLGVPIGISAALRPTYVVLIPMLWFMGERCAAKRATVTAIALLTCSFLVAGLPVWRHFFDTVSSWAFIEIDNSFQDKRFGSIVASAPAIIEGLDFSKALPYYGAGSTIGALFKQPWAVALSPVMTIVIMFSAVLTTWWMSRRNVPRTYILLLLSIAPIIVEFSGVMRNTYADVSFLPVVALGLAAMPTTLLFEISGVLTLLLYTGPIESQWIVHLRHFASVALVFAILLYAATRNTNGPDLLVIA
jgi:hypothetical protein